MEPLEVVQLAISKLDKLRIRYVLVGSFASSLHGFVRLTQDADLIVDLKPELVESFVNGFAGSFYVDSGMILQALRSGSSFNLIHLESSFKLDFFVFRQSPYAQEVFSHRLARQLCPDSDTTVFVQSPEDALLSKLDWFRRGGEVSEQQWRDVLGILKVQAERLDFGYLRKWAGGLQILDLLDRAVRESGIAIRD